MIPFFYFNFFRSHSSLGVRRKIFFIKLFGFSFILLPICNKHVVVIIHDTLGSLGYSDHSSNIFPQENPLTSQQFKVYTFLSRLCITSKSPSFIWSCVPSGLQLILDRYLKMKKKKTNRIIAFCENCNYFLFFLLI
jgi:hypothetical protein